MLDDGLLPFSLSAVERRKVTVAFNNGVSPPTAA
jgi:hypothetical protein